VWSHTGNSPSGTGGAEGRGGQVGRRLGMRPDRGVLLVDHPGAARHPSSVRRGMLDRKFPSWYRRGARRAGWWLHLIGALPRTPAPAFMRLNSRNHCVAGAPKRAGPQPQSCYSIEQTRFPSWDRGGRRPV